MTYTISPAGLRLIQEQEGFTSQPTPISGNVWLVGYAHVRVGAPGEAVTEAEAQALLAHDIAPAEHAVNERVSQNLTQAQYDALVSFAFSIGVDAFEKSQVLRRVNAGDMLAAACAMDAWRKGEIDGDVQIVEALVRRRAAEKALFLSDCAVISSVVMPPQLDYAASVLGAPQKPGAVANAAPKLAAVPAPVAVEPVEAAAEEESVVIDLGARISAILRSEPATEVLLLTQRVEDSEFAEEDEITTAHAKPVARTLADVREATRRAHAEAQEQNKTPWWSKIVETFSRNDHAQGGFALSFEHGGLAALMIFGLGLVTLAGSLLFDGGADAIQMIAAAAIAAPGIAAALMAGYGFMRAPQPKAVAA
ncbi:MAG: lysozyme [Hyphomonadaceae bacterium]|nr:lysozyme [Hyphomonadaceae bacterium]